nr:hypothetical protein CFP56_39801 [Quercus suber]
MLRIMRRESWNDNWKAWRQLELSEANSEFQRRNKGLEEDVWTRRIRGACDCVTVGMGKDVEGRVGWDDVGCDKGASVGDRLR